jgi:hypothetical protein
MPTRSSCPIITLLNGLGLVMIHRIDLAHGTSSIGDGVALRQLMWSALSVGLAMAAIVIMRDHRVLRRYTFTRRTPRFRPAPAAACCRSSARQDLRLPDLDLAWGSMSPFSPERSPRSSLAIFFAGYLVQTRDALSVAGRHLRSG